MHDSSPPPGSGGSEMRRTLGFPGVFGQSIAGEAPTATPTVNIAIVFVAAGSGSWLSYLIATIAILLVASNIVPVARTISGAGSLSEFVGQGMGPFWKLVCAWALLLGYLACSVAVLAGSAGYAASLFGAAGLEVPLGLMAVLLGIACCALVLRDVRVSTGMMLALEIVSITLVLILCVLILVTVGMPADFSQFRLEGLSASGLSSAVLIALLSFAGFEEAAALGDEAKDPLRTIPQALFAVPLVTGIFFIFCAYVLVLGFTRYNIDVANSSAPIDALANAIERPYLGLLIAFGATISLFGCTMANIVAASRIALSMARENALPAWIGRLDAGRGRPTRAVVLALAIVLPLAVGFAFFVTDSINLYDWFGTFGTFGVLTAYVLTCIASPRIRKKAGSLTGLGIALSAAALAILAFVFWGSLYPPQPAPLNYLPYGFVILMICCVVGSAVARRAERRE